MSPADIKTLLLSGLPDCEITVEGDDRHFNIVVVGQIFFGLRPVQRQQLVYTVLRDCISDGSIHAVNMKTFTLEEWQLQ
jgi:acid stress-induced BolA-like protein IbaG/YrbA|tara:strand:- start:2325 stop:2561 length:237 start_codon:yes stop_codon:yes gene_type:complete